MPDVWILPAGSLPDHGAWLASLGAQPVAVSANNHPDIIALMLAAIERKVDLAFLPARLPPAVVRKRLTDLGNPPLVSDRNDLPANQRCWPGKVFTGQTVSRTGTRRATGLLLPSSGSTRKTAWHRLPWSSVQEAAATGANVCGMVPGDPWLCCLPLEHVGGAMLALRTVAAGSDLILCRGFQAIQVSACIDEVRVVGLSLVPTMLRRLVEHRKGRAFPPTLRHLIVGGAGCDDHLREAAGALGCFPRLTYGLTETCAMVCLQTPEEAAAGPGCGRPLPGRDIRIRDARRTAFQSSEAGDIQVISPATGARWYTTGDHGWMLPDGQLLVTGRSATRIVSGGVTLAAEAIEEILRHHPAVDDAAVCGIPDEEWGERVVALLVGRRTDLTDWCRDHLEPAARPKLISWSYRMPETSFGKVDRIALRDLMMMGR